VGGGADEGGGVNELSLFSGAGGGLLGTKLLGWTTVGYCERDAYCQAVLQARIRDGLLDSAPIFGDVRAFLRDGWAERYRGLVDVVTAGFPCQPFSVAGKRLAHADERNLWPETTDVIRRVRPRFALLENVPGLAAHPYFGTVLGDLAALGFDAEWTVLGADDCGAPHRRKRLWILAHRAGDGRLEWRTESAGIEGRPDAAERGLADADPERCAQRGLSEGEGREGIPDSAGRGGVGSDPGGCDPRGAHLADAGGQGSQKYPRERGDAFAEFQAAVGASWWARDPADEGPESESFVGRVAHGVACRVDRLRALGNGQVPAVVVRAWRELSARIRA